MNLNLEGKRALVTASTGGIGLAIAKRLLEEGASVVVNGRGANQVAATVRELQASIGTPGRADQTVQGLAANLATEEGIREMKARFTEFDVVINNLGIYESKRFDRIGPSDWLRLFETNVVSGAEVTRAYLPGMLKRNEGRIVFIASETAVNVPPDMIAYAASKAAQVAMARGYAETTKGTSVTVNSVLPGPTYSEGVKKYIDDVMGTSEGGSLEERQKAFIAQLRPSSLIQRFEQAHEVSALVAFLASPLSSATNGAALRVEGGLLRNAF